MKEDKPLVSVIIPTYSRPTNLIRAIESVLNQTYKNIEIIVVDDNGIGTSYQEETNQLLKPYIDEGKIKYICHEKNKNGSAARNTGFKVSKGEFINFLDDDDELTQNKIELQLKDLIFHPQYDGCYCDTMAILKHRKAFINSPECLPEPVMESMLIGEIFFNTSTVLFTRKSITELGGFDETFWRHQDWELYVRFFRNFKMRRTDKTYILKHSSPNIISANPKKSIEYFEYFISKFREDIEKYQRKNQIFNFQYITIANQLIISRFYKEGLSRIRMARKYGEIGLRNYIKIMFCVLRSIIRI